MMHRATIRSLREPRKAWYWAFHSQFGGTAGIQAHNLHVETNGKNPHLVSSG